MLTTKIACILPYTYCFQRKKVKLQVGNIIIFSFLNLNLRLHWEQKAYLNSCTSIRHLLQLIGKPDPFSLHNRIIKWAPMKLFEAMNCISYIRDYLLAVNILIYQLLNECRISNMLILENHQDSLSFIPKFRITHIRSSGIQRIVKLCNKNECILLIAPHTQFSSYPRNVRFKINVFKNEKIKQLNFFRIIKIYLRFIIWFSLTLWL